jgi:hypothetical protein
MRAYRKTPTRGWCPLPEAVFSKHHQSALDKLEAMLHFFHVCCKDAIGTMDDVQRIAFLANVGVAAADALAGIKPSHNPIPALIDATRQYFEKVKDICSKSGGKHNLPQPQEHWIDFTPPAVADEGKPPAKKPKVAEKEEAKLLPRVITFDERTGKPTNAQDSRSTASGEAQSAAVAVPWKSWLASPGAQAMSMSAAHIGAIQMVLRAHHTNNQVGAKTQVDIMVDIKTGRKSVCSCGDIDKGCLHLFPGVPKSNRVHTKSTHPERARIQVWAPDDYTTSQLGEIDADAVASEYFLHPEWKHPELEGTPEEISQAGPDAVPCKWSGDETMYPYWAVERITAEELRKRQVAKPQLRFNMEVTHREYACVVGGSVGTAILSKTHMIKMPILHNVVDLKIGEELLIDSGTKQSQKQQKKDIDWKDAVKKGKDKKAPDEKSTPKGGSSLSVPMEV